MAREYQLISKGVPQQGLSRDEVAKRLQLHTKNPQMVEKLLAERILIVKRSRKKEDLKRYANLLHQCGLAIDLLAVGGPLELEDDAETDFRPIQAPKVVRVEKGAPDVVSAQDADSDTNNDDETESEFQSPEANSSATVPASDTPPASTDASRWQQIKYAFDNFMASGSSAMFKALVAIFLGSFLLIGLLRSLFLAIFPSVEQQNQTGFWGSLYTTFLQLTDPGNMAQDVFSSGWYKFFAVIAGIVGVILFSALIAFLTSALEQKLRDLRQGRSTVIEQDHTLIIGWNDERVIEILRELIIANESEDYACVVILADKDKEEMDELIRLRLANHGTTRIVTRSGKVTLYNNLQKVAIDRCKSIILLADCKDTDASEVKTASDAKIIQTILAVTSQAKEQTIVAEIFNPTYKEIVESTLSPNIVIVNSSEILAKLLVQTSRSVGLSVVYNELLSFDGCEIYFYHNQWPNTPFSELAFHFLDGVPIGYKDSFGRLYLNPDGDYVLHEGDEIIIVANDDSTITVKASPICSASLQPLPNKKLSKRAENQLLIGWNQKSPIVIEEFAEYVIDGAIDVLLKNPDDMIRREINALNQRLDNLKVELIEKDHLNRDELLSLEPTKYDNIIIFSTQGRDCDAQQVDSENIVCLLLLRHIFQEKKFQERKFQELKTQEQKINEHSDEEEVKTKLITEVMDSQNHSLVSQAGVKDIIISSRLLSMVMAQISENQDIKMVYDDIFAEDGSEIYLKPAHLYFENLPQQVSFGQMMRQAQQREEICIGVKIKAGERDSEQNFGVQLIPDKNSDFVLNEEDCLVVLAEDEL